MADSKPADSKRSVRGQPESGPGDTRQAGVVPPIPVEPTANHAIDRTLWLVLCLLVGSSMISLTGLIFFIGWIVAL